MCKPQIHWMIAVTTVVATGSLMGQQPTGDGPELMQAPLVAESLGLEMRLPVNSSVTTDPSASQLAYLVTDGHEVPRWTLRIQVLKASSPRATAASLIDDYLEAIQQTGGEFTLIANEPTLHANVQGHRLYISQELTSFSSTVNGWVVIPTGPGTFLVVTIAASPESFVAVRPLIEASLATIRVQRQDQRAAMRTSKLAAGRRAVSLFTETKLRSFVGVTEWYRVYMPAAVSGSGRDEEQAWFKMQYTEAQRGELNPERDPAKFNGIERMPGLMLSLDAHLVGDPAQRRTIDVQSRFWLSWDRSHESWSIRQTERVDGREVDSTAETGVRDFATLTVIFSVAGRQARTPQQWTLPDSAYLSQPEIYLLGSLLPRDGTMTKEMAFYAYDSRSQKMPLRTDRWEQATDGSRNWILTTKPAVDADEIKQLFGPNGRRQRRMDASGLITAQIDPDDLQRLWRGKGPIGR